ncbi:MAG: P1 family peptidase, partial [Pseudomonadales bacterium]
MRPSRIFIVLPLLALALSAGAEDPRGRARDFGVVPGVFAPGPLNALTDVAGIKVGHKTLVEGDRIRTGVTAIIPGPGNLYTHPMPAWIHVGNGYGKLIGETQVREFGELETP